MCLAWPCKKWSQFGRDTAGLRNASVPSVVTRRRRRQPSWGLRSCTRPRTLSPKPASVQSLRGLLPHLSRHPVCQLRVTCGDAGGLQTGRPVGPGHRASSPCLPLASLGAPALASHSPSALSPAGAPARRAGTLTERQTRAALQLYLGCRRACSRPADWSQSRPSRRPTKTSRCEGYLDSRDEKRPRRAPPLQAPPSFLSCSCGPRQASVAKGKRGGSSPAWPPCLSFPVWIFIQRSLNKPCQDDFTSSFSRAFVLHVHMTRNCHWNHVLVPPTSNRDQFSVFSRS